MRDGRLIRRKTRTAQMLAEVSTVQEATHIADMAHAAHTYAKRAKLGREAQTRAATIRFQAERKMQHPHILPLFDSGEADPRGPRPLCSPPGTSSGARSTGFSRRRAPRPATCSIWVMGSSGPRIPMRWPSWWTGSTRCRAGRSAQQGLDDLAEAADTLFG